MKIHRMYLQRIFIFILYFILYLFICTLLRTHSTYLVNLHFVLTQLNILYSNLTKYKLLSNYVTLYFYQMLFWTEYKWPFGKVMNCGESTWGWLELKTFHLIIRMFVAILWPFMFCVRVRHYGEFVPLSATQYSTRSYAT